MTVSRARDKYACATGCLTRHPHPHLSGSEHRGTIGPIIAHIANHSTHHRGQISFVSNLALAKLALIRPSSSSRACPLSPPHFPRARAALSRHGVKPPLVDLPYFIAERDTHEKATGQPWALQKLSPVA